MLRSLYVQAKQKQKLHRQNGKFHKLSPKLDMFLNLMTTSTPTANRILTGAYRQLGSRGWLAGITNWPQGQHSCSSSKKSFLTTSYHQVRLTNPMDSMLCPCLFWLLASISTFHMSGFLELAICFFISWVYIRMYLLSSLLTSSTCICGTLECSGRFNERLYASPLGLHLHGCCIMAYYLRPLIWVSNSSLFIM